MKVPHGMLLDPEDRRTCRWENSPSMKQYLANGTLLDPSARTPGTSSLLNSESQLGRGVVSTHTSFATVLGVPIPVLSSSSPILQ